MKLEQKYFNSKSSIYLGRIRWKKFGETNIVYRFVFGYSRQITMQNFPSSMKSVFSFIHVDKRGRKVLVTGDQSSQGNLPWPGTAHSLSSYSGTRDIAHFHHNHHYHLTCNIVAERNFFKSLLKFCFQYDNLVVIIVSRGRLNDELSHIWSSCLLWILYYWED